MLSAERTGDSLKTLVANDAKWKAENICILFAVNKNDTGGVRSNKNYRLYQCVVIIKNKLSMQ